MACATGCIHWVSQYAQAINLWTSCSVLECKWKMWCCLYRFLLTHRRVHKGSLLVNMTGDNLRWKSLVAENKLFTLEYIKELAPVSLKRWLLSGYMQFSFDIALSGLWPHHIFMGTTSIIKHISFTKGLIFPMIIVTGKYFKKGYSIVKWIRKYNASNIKPA